MAEPIVVTVSHRLGREEAKRRIDNGLEQVRAQLASFNCALDYSQDRYRIDFTVAAMRQRVSGHTEIEDELVRVEIVLPLLLRLLANQIIARVRHETSRLLDKP